MKVVSLPVDFEGEVIDLEELDNHMRVNPLYTGWKIELDGQVQLVYVQEEDADLAKVQATHIEYVNKRKTLRERLGLDKIRGDDNSLTHIIKGRDTEDIGKPRIILDLSK